MFPRCFEPLIETIIVETIIVETIIVSAIASIEIGGADASGFADLDCWT